MKIAGAKESDIKLFRDKLITFRKKKKITSEELSKHMRVARSTISRWENNKTTPSETQIRAISKYLKVRVDEISNLSLGAPASEIKYSENIKFVKNFISAENSLNMTDQSKSLIELATQLSEKISSCNLIINALLSSLPFMLYIKNTDLKYAFANEHFMKGFSLDKDFSILNKTDHDFFPKNEYAINEMQDKQVLISGKSILSEEGFIPGSRKQKWGLISKVPIYDSEGNIEGIMGYFIDITSFKEKELLEA